MNDSLDKRQDAMMTQQEYVLPSVMEDSRARGTSVAVMLDIREDRCYLVDASQPQLRLTDLGIMRGDGIFETLLARRGIVKKPAAHLERLAASARASELEVPPNGLWLSAMALALERFVGVEEAQVKLMLSRGTEHENKITAWVYVSDCSGLCDTARQRGIDVLLLDRGYDSALARRAPWLLMGAKTLSYAINMAAQRHAKACGADDVIFTSSDGLVLEGTTSTVIIARTSPNRGDGKRTLLTPPLDCGILPGTTQAALFQLASMRGWNTGYAELRPSDLLKADGVWLVSSVRLVAPINHLNGAPLKNNPGLRNELYELALCMN